MKVNCQNNSNISFKGFYNNKMLKKGLEFAANNGTLFAASTTLVFSTFRPLIILATPNTDKKNKQIACSKSITSSVNGYLIALACSRPFSNAIEKIDKNPELYLKKETINYLKDLNKNLVESDSYLFGTQLFKLGLGFIIAAPKAFLTALMTPYMTKLITNYETISKKNNSNNENLSFQGKDKLPTFIGRILDNKNLQAFLIKNNKSNFPMHTIAATDTLSTAVFVHEINSHKNFKREEKKPLIYNSIISTTLSILSTYIIDNLTKNSTNKFIENFKKVNKNDAKLTKYIEGIKIAKPILIAGTMYYCLIPLISTFFADRIKTDKIN